MEGVLRVKKGYPICVSVLKNESWGYLILSNSRLRLGAIFGRGFDSRRLHHQHFK